MKTSCYKVIANYIKLKVIFNCRLYRALHGSETWLSKCNGWERFVFWKTEKFFIRENFTKLLEDTYALVKDLSGGDILKGLMIHNYSWDKVNYINPDAQRIIDALSIFITKMDPEEGKDFIGFNGFDCYANCDETPLTKTFPNRLCNFKLEYLTIEDCLIIQQKFDNFYLSGYEFGATAKKLFDYIDNMVQMRIALEKYSEKTCHKCDSKEDE